MAVRLKQCDPERLRLLAEDRLAPAEVEGLEVHVQGCAECREALDRMAGGEPWLEAVRHYLGGDATDLYEEISPRDIGDSLNFLAPSDWPDSLGRLGTYEIKGMIGRGGMGVVLKAFDPALSRNVAIKVLSAHLANCGAARRRFLREARAAAAVAHEHVVSVFAVVETTGLPFLVMEYLPGGSLQDRLDKEGPLALAAILRIGMQTAAGLAAAHAQGLVHRDVKPANILLENGIERVKLTDFGLARAAADAGMTQSGLVAGTPYYMAPEQARGEATDQRADLFSLGSTIYAMCAGHPPFRADSPLAVIRRVSDDEPRPVREINPEIPEWLEAIILRLHAKDPNDRFSSASELANLLGRCLAHIQQPLAVVLPAELAKGPERRRYLLRTVGAGLLGCVAILGGFLFLSAGRSPAPRLPDPQSAVQSTEFPVLPPRVEASQNSLDEIDQSAAIAKQRAESIDVDLHRSADSGCQDLLSKLVRGLADRAGSLERQIVSGREPAPSVAEPFHSFQTDDRR